MPGVKIKEVTTYLESLAPPAYQESYDNSGLITGDSGDDVSGLLVTLDCTEEVVQEAVKRGCNLIVAHHPILFKGLKRLTGSTYIERTIILAIRHNIAIYAIHTNLDNVHTGVNKIIAERIGLQNVHILAPRKDTLSKLSVFIPVGNVEEVLAALHQAGAGQIGNYRDCSFQVQGTGSFTPNAMANPHIGVINKQEFVKEIRTEVIFPTHLEQKIINILNKVHPYEEVAYYLSPLANENQEVGSGMIGELDKPVEPIEFLKRLKITMDVTIVRHTALINKRVKKVAVCGGAGSFLLQKAINAGADVFVTADFKYHEFFDADKKVVIADIGHYESEVFTKDLLKRVLMEKFNTFAINFSETVTNPISYL